MRWIENKTGAVVCLHIQHPLFLDHEALRLAPDQYLHHGEYCREAKLNGFLNRCSDNKVRSLKIASSGRCFHGSCPMGVWDMAFPVRWHDLPLAVVYLGGFRGTRLFGEHFPYHGELPPEITEEKIHELRRHGAFIREFILLEFEFLMKTGCSSTKKHDAEYYVKNTLFYIDCNFASNLSIEDPAETLGVTPGYLGEVLKSRCRKNFRDILNERRIREAEVYLKFHKTLSIGQIAALCGFSDSNYFSTVYHRLTGMSPRASRKNAESSKKN